MAQHIPPQSPSFVTPIFALLCWPLLATQFWLEMTGAVLSRDSAETDSGDASGQLPVPDAIQDTMDAKLFA